MNLFNLNRCLSAKRMRPLFACCLIALGATGILAGCGGSGSSSSASGNSSSGESSSAEKSIKGEKVFYLGGDQANPFQVAYDKTMVDGLRNAGLDVSELHNSFDASVQAQQMAAATAQDPAAIVVFVADSTAIVPSLARASQAGIPVMVVGTNLDKSALGYVKLLNLQDSPELGKFAAMNLVEGMEKEGLKKGNVIALTGTSSQIDVQERMAAFKAYLSKYPQFKLVEEQDVEWEATVAATDAKALYAKYASKGGIQGVYGMADYLAVGAIKAAKGAGLPVGLPNKGIIFTGSNCSSAGIVAMKAGELYGDATQAPTVEAEAALQKILPVMEGEEPESQTTINPEERFTEKDVGKFAKLCTY